MDIKITVARSDMIDGLWTEVWAYLKPAIDEDMFHSEESLKKLLLDDCALMFLAYMDGIIKGAAVVQIDGEKYPLTNILTLGGEDFVHWKAQMNEAITKYAQFHECRYIVAAGRKGWARLWPDFMAGKTVFCKEITA